MECPSCRTTNLPVRESSGYLGSSVYHPHFCGNCGEALTEKCAVCSKHHPIGTAYCVINGKNIAAYVEERDRWKEILGGCVERLDAEVNRKIVTGTLLGMDVGMIFAIVSAVVYGGTQQPFYYFFAAVTAIGAIAFGAAGGEVGCRAKAKQVQSLFDKQGLEHIPRYVSLA